MATGWGTTASGNLASAMGFNTKASGNSAMATGYATKAIGPYSAAFGFNTEANCGAIGSEACVAMGFVINNTEAQSLAVSGNVLAHNVKLFGADARLAKRNVTDADPAALLANIEKLRVVERAPSANYCKHQHRDAAECAKDLGLLAQRGHRGPTRGRLGRVTQTYRCGECVGRHAAGDPH